MFESRSSRFALEALVLVALAFSLAAAQLNRFVIAGGMLLGWLVVTLLDWSSLRGRAHFGAGSPSRYYEPELRLPAPRAIPGSAPRHPAAPAPVQAVTPPPQAPEESITAAPELAASDAAAASVELRDPPKPVSEVELGSAIEFPPASREPAGWQNELGVASALEVWSELSVAEPAPIVAEPAPIVAEPAPIVAERAPLVEEPRGVPFEGSVPEPEPEPTAEERAPGVEEAPELWLERTVAEADLTVAEPEPIVEATSGEPLPELWPELPASWFQARPQETHDPIDELRTLLPEAPPEGSVSELTPPERDPEPEARIPVPPSHGEPELERHEPVDELRPELPEPAAEEPLSELTPPEREPEAGLLGPPSPFEPELETQEPVDELRPELAEAAAEEPVSELTPPEPDPEPEAGLPAPPSPLDPELMHWFDTGLPGRPAALEVDAKERGLPAWALVDHQAESEREDEDAAPEILPEERTPLLDLTPNANAGFDVPLGEPLPEDSNPESWFETSGASGWEQDAVEETELETAESDGSGWEQDALEDTELETAEPPEPEFAAGPLSEFDLPQTELELDMLIGRLAGTRLGEDASLMSWFDATLPGAVSAAEPGLTEPDPFPDNDPQVGGWLTDSESNPVEVRDAWEREVTEENAAAPPDATPTEVTARLSIDPLAPFEETNGRLWGRKHDEDGDNSAGSVEVSARPAGRLLLPGTPKRDT